jgi:hypothetical protein
VSNSYRHELVSMTETPSTSPSTEEPRLPRLAALAFAPIHKRALGTAVGVALALAVFAVTVMHAAVQPSPAPPLYLLGQYFYGYEVSFIGAFIGGFWAFVAGFVAGWFFAFWRNFAMAAHVFIIRTRVELAQTRDFLDHI